MAYGLVGAHREELKDKQLLSLRTELRNNRLNGSGSSEAGPLLCTASRGASYMSKLAIVATTLVAVFGGGQQRNGGRADAQTGSRIASQAVWLRPRQIQSRQNQPR